MPGRTRFVGINHVAIEVGDLDEALDFYGRIFDVELRGRTRTMAFIDAGDQFIALSEGRTQPPDAHRHFGLVVENKQAAVDAVRETGIEVRGNDFRDPWGNYVQVVQYSDVQFTKAPEVLGAMRLSDLNKSDQARRELREKGIGDDRSG